jgi:hypothetical protein
VRSTVAGDVVRKQAAGAAQAGETRAVAGQPAAVANALMSTELQRHGGIVRRSVLGMQSPEHTSNRAAATSAPGMQRRASHAWPLRRAP